jgi:hypothetical protein
MNVHTGGMTESPEELGTGAHQVEMDLEIGPFSAK